MEAKPESERISEASIMVFEGSEEERERNERRVREMRSEAAIDSDRARKKNLISLGERSFLFGGKDLISLCSLIWGERNALSNDDDRPLVAADGTYWPQNLFSSLSHSHISLTRGLELPFRSDADVLVEENVDFFRFVAESEGFDVDVVEIHPGLTKDCG
ncbi:hypothetical protein G4B88_005870 [Cannabis sativa]|uniref:Uncharacterized protein n=1 Tax=Cannabis sativa TaxID=3483 RepID=A0A7J6IA72_CANSA|nr:hypothetical protein G4B88_005870 [Cannabis sativa]